MWKRHKVHDQIYQTQCQEELVSGEMPGEGGKCGCWIWAARLQGPAPAKVGRRAEQEEVGRGPGWDSTGT